MIGGESERGIVRPARRPPGWCAPGPLPAGPGTRADLHPGPHEDLCHLSGDWRIFQRVDGHRWSLDDLVTAWYAIECAAGRSVRRHLDLGCGIGSVLLMIAWSLPDARCLGVEAQPLSVALARRSIAYDGVQHRCEARHADLRVAGAIPEGRVFDLVTGTPPYFAASAGTVSPNVQRGPCRFELRGGIEEYAVVAGRVMVPGGCFVACETAGRIDRIRRACRAAGLELLHWRDVVPRAGKPPLFTVFAASEDRGHPIEGERRPLIVRDRLGRRTAEFVAARERMGMPP